MLESARSQHYVMDKRKPRERLEIPRYIPASRIIPRPQIEAITSPEYVQITIGKVTQYMQLTIYNGELCVGNKLLLYPGKQARPSNTHCLQPIRIPRAAEPVSIFSDEELTSFIEYVYELYCLYGEDANEVMLELEVEYMGVGDDYSLDPVELGETIYNMFLHGGAQLGDFFEYEAYYLVVSRETDAESEGGGQLLSD